MLVIPEDLAYTRRNVHLFLVTLDRSVTFTQVAETSGVSVAAISRFVRDRDCVSDTIVAKIAEALLKMNLLPPSASKRPKRTPRDFARQA